MDESTSGLFFDWVTESRNNSSRQIRILKSHDATALLLKTLRRQSKRLFNLKGFAALGLAAWKKEFERLFNFLNCTVYKAARPKQLWNWKDSLSWTFELMNEEMIDWLTYWENERLRDWMNEWTNECVNECSLNEWLNEWTNEWNNQRTNQWIHDSMKQQINERMKEWPLKSKKWMNNLFK